MARCHAIFGYSPRVGSGYAAARASAQSALGACKVGWVGTPRGRFRANRAEAMRRANNPKPVSDRDRLQSAKG